MQIWQVQEAKAKLTQLIKDAENEPQIISKHGVETCVVISTKKYKELTSSDENIVSFLKNSPLNETELDFQRDKSLGRELDL